MHCRNHKILLRSIGYQFVTCKSFHKLLNCVFLINKLLIHDWSLVKMNKLLLCIEIVHYNKSYLKNYQVKAPPKSRDYKLLNSYLQFRILLGIQRVLSSTMLLSLRNLTSVSGDLLLITILTTLLCYSIDINYFNKYILVCKNTWKSVFNATK